MERETPLPFMKNSIKNFHISLNTFLMAMMLLLMMILMRMLRMMRMMVVLGYANMCKKHIVLCLRANFSFQNYPAQHLWPEVMFYFEFRINHFR